MRMQRARLGQLSLEAVGQEREAGPHITHELCMREIHLLDRRWKVTHMQHDRTVRPHKERRLLDGIVTYGDDQICPVDRPMHVVPLGQRSRAHVEPGAASDRALAHLRVEERDLQALHETRQGLGQVRTACSRTQHHQGPLSLEDQFGCTIQCCARCNGPVNRVGWHGQYRRRSLAGDVFRQLEMRLGPGALNLATGAAFALLGAMPMIMITGQKGILSRKQARFQVVDMVSAMTPLTKMMPNSSTFIDEFQSYSSTACASIGTVSRAMNHILAKFKI